jgi:general secretion pathway protein K
MLATFAVILGYSVRQKISLAMRLEQRDRARYLFWANIKVALVEIKNKEKRQVLSAQDNRFSQVYSQAREEDDEKPDSMENIYGIFDEERKVNINKADLHLLERLFKILLGYGDIEAQELAAAIVDWRDKDSMLSIPLGSAEDSYYTSLRYPYEAKDADFDCLEELLLVKGVTGEVFERVSDYLTVYTDGLVNINTAPREVLFALGLSEYLVNNIVSFRCGKDKKCGTEDDNFFASTSEVAVLLGNFCALNEAQRQQIENVAARDLTVESNYFMIKSIVKFNRRQNAFRATCVADSLGKVLYWQEL